jgi:hypothetical protein
MLTSIACRAADWRHAGRLVRRGDAGNQTLELPGIGGQFSGYFRLSTQCANRDIFGTLFNALAINQSH